MGNMYYGDGTNKRLLSGIAQVPRLTLAQYQALTVKPRFWVRTDAPETYNQLLTWDDQAELGSKNIIKYPYAYGGGSTHGLTVTVNADGSVTASGQPNQAIGWVMITNIITEYDLQVGDKLIFSEHEVNNNNASAALTYVNPASPLDLVQGDYELTVTSEMVTKGVSFILWFNNGVNLSTPVTFKPMVRLTSCSDSTWASPALTNRKLTELATYLSETKIKQLEAGIASASTATGTEYSSGVSVKQKIDSLIPTRTHFTPNYGASSDLGYRNFFLTDNSTFLEIHFCLRCQTAINADVDLITLPTIAQNKTPQYGVGIETSNNKSHIVYNNGNYMYLDGTNITADFNGVFAGTFRMSLV